MRRVIWSVTLAVSLYLAALAANWVASGPEVTGFVAQYRPWLWVLVALGLVLTVVSAITEARRRSSPAPEAFSLEKPLGEREKPEDGVVPEISPIQFDTSILDIAVTSDPLYGLLYTPTGATTPNLMRYLESLEDRVYEDFSPDRYIELSSQALDKADLLARSASVNDADFPMTKRLAERTQGRKISVVDAISLSRKVVILGEPGIGKTTELRNAILAQIGMCRTRQVRIPVWASLADWSDTAMTVEEFLQLSLSNLWPFVSVDSEIFLKLLRAGVFSIYLDGLNELPQRERPQSQLRDDTEKKYIDVGIDRREEDIIKLAESSTNQIILSCRTFDYSYIPGWRTFEVVPLNEKQIMAFVRHNLGDESQFREAIERNPGLKPITSIPFLLRSLIDLISYGDDVSSRDRFELVQHVYLRAVERESKRMVLQPQEVLRLVGELSLSTMEKGIIGSGFQIERVTDNSEQTLDESDADGIALMTALNCCAGAGVLTIRSNDDASIRIRYRHQLVQESLALHFLETISNDTSADIMRAKALYEIQ